MKRITLFFAILIYIGNSYSQCTVTGFRSTDTIVCGGCATFSAYGRGQGQIIFQENFNSGTPVGWQYTQQAMFNNPCSPNGVDGTTHIWMGNSSPVPRALVTQSYNFSTGTAGVTICFDMLFAVQGDAAPCEGPDEPDEGVYLQYSTNNGTTWNTVHYFDPNGGSDPDLINWHNWCFQLPAGAVTSNTQIRWFQDNDSGADYDHWGIDNVQIYFNDPTYNIVWLHDNYSLGATGGVDPTPVCPRTSTNYVVKMSNATSTCYDTVRINVKMPQILLDAHPDTNICIGNCANLHSTGKVILSPAKIARYSNDELTPVVTGLGQLTSIDINITTLNMTNVIPNSILGVCIHDLRYFGQTFFPTPQVVGIGALIITLKCPDGTIVELVPAGVTTNTLPTDGYHTTCFVPVGGSNIASAFVPYTGSYAPSQPLSGLDGCTANGLWSMNITMTSALGFGTGTFLGWEIVFDDPEISYQGDFVWSPTTSLTNFNTLAPTTCAQNNITYRLTVSDTAGCVSQTDSVRVRASNCCGFTISNVITKPSCNQNNGSINLTVNPSGTNYTYLWSNGAQTQDISGIGAGSYSVVVTDVNTNCSLDTIFIVSESNTFTRQIDIIDSHCGRSDGSASVTCTGGTGTYYYTWNTVPQTIISSISNVSAGDYIVTVSDGICTYTLTVTVVDLPGPTAEFTSQPTVMTDMNPTCNFSDQSTGNINTWFWNFGDGTSSNTSSPSHNFEGLGTFNVMLIVIDRNGCSDTVVHPVKVRTEMHLYIPNSFTPNADGINETFGPSIPFDDLMEYDFRIFNKWGEQLFYTNDIKQRWDGYLNGNVLQEDVYVYNIYARDSVGKEYKYVGRVTLIR